MDGTLDSIILYTFDGEGRLIRREHQIVPGGSAEVTWEFEYGETADPIRTSTDYDGDGDWDSVSTRTTCD